jgi:nucleotide-binding universal stress UspA family protein
MKLLVPLDGSAASACALNHALWLAEHHPGALLILVNVQNAQTLGLPDVMRAEGEAVAAQESEEILKKPVARCQRLQTRCEARAEYGPVAETIHRIARETMADQSKLPCPWPASRAAITPRTTSNPSAIVA